MRSTASTVDGPVAGRPLLAGVAALTAATLLGTALSPFLLSEHPLVLIGLNSSSSNLVLAASNVEPWQAVVVGALRRGLAFASAFALACAYREKLIGWIESKPASLARIARAIEVLYARMGLWLVVLVPIYPVAVFAGIARMRWRRFLIPLVPGQVAFVVVILRFGEVIDVWTRPVVAFVAENSLSLTIAATAMVAGQQAWSRLCRRANESEYPLLPAR